MQCDARSEIHLCAMSVYLCMREMMIDKYMLYQCDNKIIIDSINCLPNVLFSIIANETFYLHLCLVHPTLCSVAWEWVRRDRISIRMQTQNGNE